MGKCKRDVTLLLMHLIWIGLDLFNDDTRPSGHISRPTQVNVSELLSFSKQLLKSNNIVQSGG